jgi:hypothetical protein
MGTKGLDQVINAAGWKQLLQLFWWYLKTKICSGIGSSTTLSVRAERVKVGLVEEVPEHAVVLSCQHVAVFVVRAVQVPVERADQVRRAIRRDGNVGQRAFLERKPLLTTGLERLTKVAFVLERGDFARARYFRISTSVFITLDHVGTPYAASVHMRAASKQVPKQVGEELIRRNASLPRHADDILNELEKRVGLSFAGRLNRHDCFTIEDARDRYIQYRKDLRVLQRDGDMRKIVLVDNKPVNFQANPDNGILVRDFRGDANDTTLFAVSDLLRQLDSVDDVRSVLQDRLRMKEGFANINKLRLLDGLHHIVLPLEL